MPKTNGAGSDNSGTPFSLPASLDDLTVDQLDELSAQARAEFDTIYSAEGGASPAEYERASKLVDGIEAIEARKAGIQQEAADNAAKFDELAGRLAPKAEEPADAEPADAEPETAPTTPQPALTTASGRGVGGAQTASRELGGLDGPRHRLNPTLSGARSAAPPAAPPKRELAMTASVGLPGQLQPGGEIKTMRQLGEIAEKMAKSMPNQAGRYTERRPGDPYGGVQIASIANDFLGDTILGEDSSQDAIDAYIERVNGSRLASKFESIVAGGGWCAPPENRYDFFNVACEGGAIDLPTFGVTRGGINFPTSPSLADTFSPALPWYTAFSNATVPWLWTNTDDVATVTGTPNKPCIRVPCATMNPVLLECYGICLTAGNLADNAWPESTRNFLRLLMAAHFHASNARYLAQISAAAVSITGGSCAAGSGAIAPILGTAEMAAWDYRTKFGMCDDDVLEWILPSWAKGLIRSDLAKRTREQQDFLNVTDAQIAAWFDTRNLRVQFVDDFQVRAAGQPGASTPITSYPSTVNGLLYAAGTVVRGNGMTLDLGVVRDSTLNAENDFTAAWMEECHLIAKIGHEIRNYTINVCPDGTVGAADLTACCP
jgi:hypothetical protein